VAVAVVCATTGVGVGVTEAACGRPGRMSSQKPWLSAMILVKMALKVSTLSCNSATMAAMWRKSSDVKGVVGLLENMLVA
jgi:hypothetical protein